jgi:signal transduction histidine kinase
MQDLISEEQQIITIILIAIGLLLLMSMAIIVFFYFSRRRIIKTELEKATLEIEHQKEVLRSTIITQEEERQRIAQDLHDAISSKLNVVSLNANLLSDSNNSSQETDRIADTILKVTATVLENSRRIAHDLLPPTLQKFGLVAALEELCDEVADTGTFEVRQKFDYPKDSLSAEEELHFFRIVQELFNNAIKYSKAESLELALGKEGPELVLSYRDDGQGFNISEAKMARGLGLSGITNRVEILNASLEMQSAPNKGLFVRISKRLE